jgi:hypothetical protein
MTHEIEKHLRGALRHVGPSEGFADRVLARVSAEGERPGEVVQLRPRESVLRRYWYSGVALAASIVLAVIGINQQQHELRVREGLEARRQLMEALRVTSEKLDIAYQAVTVPPSSADAGV